MSKTILSLFDYTGIWSDPYRNNGYDIIQIDIKYGDNIYLLEIDKLPKIHGILAAPPCTDFAVSGARWFKGKDEDGRTFRSVSLMYYTLGVIHFLKSRDNISWWVLENPVGRLNSLIPQFKKFGPRYFQPYEFGDPYTKKNGTMG